MTRLHEELEVEVNNSQLTWYGLEMFKMFVQIVNAPKIAAGF